jgi:hypothetical protein
VGIVSGCSRRALEMKKVNFARTQDSMVAIATEQGKPEHIPVECRQLVEVSRFQTDGADMHRCTGRKAGNGRRIWRIHPEYIGPCAIARKRKGALLGRAKFPLL